MARWLSDSYNVRVLDINKSRKVGNSIEFIKCDITDRKALMKAVEGSDLLVHTAIVQIPQINSDKRLGYLVNVLGTQNVCETVRESSSLRGMLLTGSWHTIGEREISGVVDERFGFRPDMVEDRARTYALSKIAQETIVRLFDEESQDKVYGIIRIGTTLGENMPSGTAADVFIDQALKGEPLTPYDHSMHRPMLYVSVRDVCRAFESYARRILDGTIAKSGNSLAEIVNVYYPEPMTILELAEAVRDSVATCTAGRVKPEIRIVSTGQRSHFTADDKRHIRVDGAKARTFLELDGLTDPREAIEKIVRQRLAAKATA